MLTNHSDVDGLVSCVGVMHHTLRHVQERARCHQPRFAVQRLRILNTVRRAYTVHGHRHSHAQQTQYWYILRIYIYIYIIYIRLLGMPKYINEARRDSPVSFLE